MVRYDSLVNRILFFIAERIQDHECALPHLSCSLFLLMPPPFVMQPISCHAFAPSHASPLCHADAGGIYFRL